jgi:hypothetical protein
MFLVYSCVTLLRDPIYIYMWEYCCSLWPSSCSDTGSLLCKVALFVNSYMYVCMIKRPPKFSVSLTAFFRSLFAPACMKSMSPILYIVVAAADDIENKKTDAECHKTSAPIHN